MVALVAEALSTDLVLEEEMEDARWFSREDVIRMLAGTHPDHPKPFAQAASGVLLKNWAEA